MAGRITLSALLTSTSLAGPVRLSGQYLMSPGNAGVRETITGQYLLVAAAAKPRERVTAQWLFVPASIHNAFYPTFLEGGQIFGIDKWTLKLVAGPTPEFNPYRPTIPDQFIEVGGDDFYHFNRENQEHIRNQHNITQAGDTTFPWQMMIEAHDDKIHTLGSISRFYHEDYGLIIARYVKFDKLSQDNSLSAPMGLIKKHGLVDWVVTNRLDLSDVNLVVGLCSHAVLPTNGQYGWVIVHGANLQAATCESDIGPIGETVGWSSNGKVSNQALGRVVGRRITTAQKNFAPGTLFIEIESFSRAQIQSFIDEVTDELADALLELQTQMADVQGVLGEDGTLDEIRDDLSSLSNRLALEEARRQNADEQLNQRIDQLNAVTQGQLDAAIAGLQATITAVISNLENGIAYALARANEAWTLANQANSINLDSIQQQLITLALRIGALEDEPKNKFPLVDGSVPPNLVYLDDGTLVWTEE